MLLTAQGAARLLGTSERQIHRWVDDEEIPHRRVRDQLRFNRTDLLEWATSRRLPVHVEAFEEDDPDDRDRAPSLAAALRVGGVHRDVEGSDRESVLRAVVARLPIPPSLDRELLVDVLLARATTGTTAIGEGIAIPHVRNPFVAPGAAATVGVCYLATPVPLDAPDGLPVQTLFMVVTPTVRTHLQMLARLARALTDAGFRAALHRGAALDELAAEAARIEADAEAVAQHPLPEGGAA
jgi:PTS system nitrogen regulatory IIA component